MAAFELIMWSGRRGRAWECCASTIRALPAGGRVGASSQAVRRAVLRTDQLFTDVMGLESVDVTYTGKVTYHDSCSSLREMGVKGQPRKLLKTVESLDLVEMEQTEVCCGFGGSFALNTLRFPRGWRRQDNECRGDWGPNPLAGDMGCLMNLAGRLKERSP